MGLGLRNIQKNNTIIGKQIFSTARFSRDVKEQVIAVFIITPMPFPDLDGLNIRINGSLCNL
jgi:hypothetical protein